jgi:hypothetical protein
VLKLAFHESKDEFLVTPGQNQAWKRLVIPPQSRNTFEIKDCWGVKSMNCRSWEKRSDDIPQALLDKQYPLSIGLHNSKCSSDRRATSEQTVSTRIEVRSTSVRSLGCPGTVHSCSTGFPEGETSRRTSRHESRSKPLNTYSGSPNAGSGNFSKTSSPAVFCK